MDEHGNNSNIFPKPLADWDDCTDAAIHELTEDARRSYTKVPRMAKKSDALTPESCDIIIANVRQFFKHESVSQRQLARMAGVSSTTLNELLANKYRGDPSKHCKKLNAAIEQHFQRVSAPELEHFVSTGVAKEIFAVLKYTARGDSSLGVITANSGVGKSLALRAAIKTDFPNGILIEVNPGCSSPLWFCRAILQCLRCGTSFVQGERGIGDEGVWSKAAAFNKIVAKIAGSRRLIVVDEAENLATESLNLLRQILDATGCNAVLAGRPPLAVKVRRSVKTESIGGSVIGRISVQHNLQGIYNAPSDGRWLFSVDDVTEVLNKFKVRFKPEAARWLCALANISAVADDGGLRYAVRLFKMTARINPKAPEITAAMLKQANTLQRDQAYATTLTEQISRFLQQSDSKRRQAAIA